MIRNHIYFDLSWNFFVGKYKFSEDFKNIKFWNLSQKIHKIDFYKTMVELANQHYVVKQLLHWSKLVYLITFYIIENYSWLNLETYGPRN